MLIELIKAVNEVNAPIKQRHAELVERKRKTLREFESAHAAWMNSSVFDPKDYAIKEHAKRQASIAHGQASMELYEFQFAHNLPIMR